MNPPPEPEEETPVEEEAPVESSEAPEIAIGGLSTKIATSSSFHFMQEDELERPQAEPTLDEQEWVVTDDVPAEIEPVQPPPVEVEETITEAAVNGHAIVQDTVTVTETVDVSHSSE